MSLLRIVTILATWLLMLVTMVIPIGFYYTKEGHLWNSSPTMLINLVLVSATLWFFYGSPLFVSGIISLFLKRPLSLFILLFSTIGYGIGAFYILHLASDDGSCMAGIEFFWLGPASLIFLIPVWIITMTFNSVGKKETNVSQEVTA